MQRGLSVHIGLNSVDPRHYGGWSGELAACESDARDMDAIARSAGFDSLRLLTEEAVRPALQSAFNDAIATLRNGDLFFLTYSGHGGQLPDADGEEDDFRDETWCLFDGQWVDDETYSLLQRFASGVRILIIPDSCHSGTPYRMMRQRATSAVENMRYRAMPMDIAVRTYEWNKAFYDQLTSRVRARPLADSRLNATVMSLGACQDHQLAADGEFNGRFTAALKRVWDRGAFRGDYAQFYSNIQALMPSDQTPSLRLEGSKSSDFERQQPFSIKGETDMPASQETSTSGGSGSPWRWGGISPQSGRTRSRSAAPAARASSIAEGQYVTESGRSNTLYYVENGRRRIIQPPEIERLRITQNDIQEVPMVEVRAIPLDVPRRRAVGRDLQTHLWSDIHAGHFMESWVWLQGTRLTVRTKTETVTWFGGYTGGVSVYLYDGNGNAINHPEIRFSYGVDGRAFSSGWREETEGVDVPQDVANAAEQIVITHYWDPKVDIVANAVLAVKLAWELIQIILEAQGQGEPVNAGGEPF